MKKVNNDTDAVVRVIKDRSFAEAVVQMFDEEEFTFADRMVIIEILLEKSADKYGFEKIELIKHMIKMNE